MIPCASILQSYIKIHYKNNKTKYIEKAKIHNKNYRNRNREYVENIKQNSCCARCSESDFNCLDFHHIEDKTEAIAKMSYMSCSLKKLKREIAKCIVLCSNCHRKFHASVDQRQSRLPQEQCSLSSNLSGSTNILSVGSNPT